MKQDSAPNLDRTSDVLQHNKQREAEAVSRKSTALRVSPKGSGCLSCPLLVAACPISVFVPERCSTLLSP